MTTTVTVTARFYGSFREEITNNMKKANEATSLSTEKATAQSTIDVQQKKCEDLRVEKATNDMKVMIADEHVKKAQKAHRAQKVIEIKRQKEAALASEKKKREYDEKMKAHKENQAAAMMKGLAHEGEKLYESV